MPKSAKKRKDKAADFSKAKLKLGKGKQLATNAIDTSFKARSIALPTQSITVDKDLNAPTTKRRLTFDDLVAHLKHYSAGTRKDAILGLRELFDAHWEILDSSLTTLINACVRCIGDEDAGVRKGLLDFFAWILPRIPQADLIPHSSLLLLFTTSAQTHIFPEIRIDAIRFLNILLEHIPAAVVAGWNEDNSGHGARILEGYLGILNAGTKFGETDGPLKATSTASVVLSPASKLIVLRSLSTFLQHCLSTSPSAPMPTAPGTPWYLASSFATPEAYSTFSQLLQSYEAKANSCRSWRPEVELEDGDDDFIHPPYATWPLHADLDIRDFTNTVDVTGPSGIDGFGDGSSTLIMHLARTLHSTLVATFLDCAPSVFSPAGNPPEIEVQLILAMSHISRSLYGAILQGSELTGDHPSSVADDLAAILSYMVPYFPFRPSGTSGIKLEQAFQDMNLVFCELSSLLILATKSNGLIRRTKARSANRAIASVNSSKDMLANQTLRVSEYIIQLLRGESVAASQLGRPLTAAAYLGILPTIWALLNNSITAHHEMAGAVLRATIEHALRISSKSSLQKPTTEFIARLVLLDTEAQYQGSFRLGSNPIEDQELEAWVTRLPQTLWELGSTNLPATETILRFLLRILQRKSKLVNPKTTASLRSKLIPYFCATHATRGQVFGPYRKLPVSPSLVRRLALDLVATIILVEHDHNLCAAVDIAVAETDDLQYWSQIRC